VFVDNTFSYNVAAPAFSNITIQYAVRLSSATPTPPPSNFGYPTCPSRKCAIEMMLLIDLTQLLVATLVSEMRGCESLS
jgi:hypothetical protein